MATTCGRGVCCRVGWGVLVSKPRWRSVPRTPPVTPWRPCLAGSGHVSQGGAGALAIPVPERNEGHGGGTSPGSLRVSVLQGLLEAWGRTGSRGARQR